MTHSDILEGQTIDKLQILIGALRLRNLKFWFLYLL